MEVRLLVFLSCMASLCMVASMQAAFPLLSFPIIFNVPMWTRLDQANLFASHAWADALSTLTTMAIVRSYGARPLLITAHAWQAYFSLYMVYARNSFYEFWMNRFFSSMVNGMIYGSVFHCLLQWLPSHELFAGLFVGTGMVGVGWIMGTFLAWICIVLYQSWHTAMILWSMMSLSMSLWWWRSPHLASYPHNCSRISKIELSAIHANRFHVNRQELQDTWFLMIWNSESLHYALKSFALGYVFYSLAMFHSVHYLELASLQSEISDLPFSMYYPWILWIVVGLGVGVACLRSRSGRVAGFMTSPNYRLLMGGLAFMGVILLRRMESFPSFAVLTFHLSSLYIVLALILALFVISHLYCQNSEPEVCLSLTLSCMALGGVISQELGGLILEMAGAWEVMFRYESNVLLFFSFYHLVPWVYWRFWYSRRNISLRTSDNGFL